MRYNYGVNTNLRKILDVKHFKFNISCVLLLKNYIETLQRPIATTTDNN